MATTGFEKVRGVECLYRYRPNGKYYARFAVNGKELRQSLLTTDRETAKRELARIQREEALLDDGAGTITLYALCDRYLATVCNQSKKTVAQKSYICQRIKDEWPGGSGVLIRKVVPSNIQTFLARYDFGATSHNAYLGALRAMFALAVSDRLLSSSPALGLKERRREKPIRRTPTWEEFQSIVADIRKQRFSPDAEASADFVEFIGLAGLGQAETSALAWPDVDLKRDRMTTFRQKTRTGFTVPIYPQLRPLLERLKASEDGERVFRTKDAKKAIAGACKRLGLVSYSHRSFRRMFITRAIEKGIDVKVIAEWQGHRDGGKLILDTYSHVNRVHSQRMAQLMTDAAPENVVPMQGAA